MHLQYKKLMPLSVKNCTNPCIGAWDEVYVCVIQSWRGLQKQTSKGLLCFSTSKGEKWILIQSSVNIIKVSSKVHSSIILS